MTPGIRQEKVTLHFREQVTCEASLGDALSVRAAAEATGCDWLKCWTSAVWLKCWTSAVWLKCWTSAVWLKCWTSAVWLKCWTSAVWLKCWTSAGVHFLLPDQGYARTWPRCWSDMNFHPKTHSGVVLLVFWTKTLIQYSFSSQGSLSFLFLEATTLFSLSSRCWHLFTVFSVCSLNCCSVSLVCVVHTAVQWSSVQVTCFVHSVVVLKWLFFFPFLFSFYNVVVWKWCVLFTVPSSTQTTVTVQLCANDMLCSRCSCVQMTCFVHTVIVCKWHALFTLQLCANDMLCSHCSCVQVIFFFHTAVVCKWHVLFTMQYSEVVCKWRVLFTPQHREVMCKWHVLFTPQYSEVMYR